MQTCPTCLEPLSSGSINYTVSTPCGHLFHMNCVQSWISRGNQTCPQCRRNISKEKLLRIYLQPVESETQNPHEAVEIQRNYENAPKNPSSNSVAYSRETDFVYLDSVTTVHEFSNSETTRTNPRTKPRKNPRTLQQKCRNRNGIPWYCIIFVFVIFVVVVGLITDARMKREKHWFNKRNSVSFITFIVLYKL